MPLEATAAKLRNKDDPNWEIRDFAIQGREGVPILIEGESGSGKTSILRFLMGDVGIEASESSVSYTIDGISLTVSEAKKAQVIAYAGADHPFLNWCSISHSFDKLSRCFNNRLLLDKTEIISSLASLNLTYEHLLKKPHQLSFGERRRLSILFSTSMKPKILLIDEIFNGLDNANCQLIIDFLLCPQRLASTIIVMTAHEPRLLAECNVLRFAVDTTGPLSENRVCQFRQLTS